MRAAIARVNPIGTADHDARRYCAPAHRLGARIALGVAAMLRVVVRLRSATFIAPAWLSVRQGSMV